MRGVWIKVIGGVILIMDRNVTWIQISKETKFVNVGVDDNGEPVFFKITIIDNMGLIGFIVIDPDGKLTVSGADEDAEVVSVSLSFDEREYEIQLLPSESAYELIVESRERDMVYG